MFYAIEKVNNIEARLLIIIEHTIFRSSSEYMKSSIKYIPLNIGDNSKLVICKGTTRTTVKDNITLDSIVNTLKDSSLTKHDNYSIRSKNIN